MSNENGKSIKVTEYGDKSGAKIDIYSRDPRVEHDSIHIKVNTNNKTFETVTKINGKKESSQGGCYLTTACMIYMQEKFDDNCYELSVLRWFRDCFVSKEDIKHYYETAPMIVSSINVEEKSDLIYNYIYDNIVDYCVKQIENGNYEETYNRYKNSILVLEEQFARKSLEERLVKVLRLRTN